MNNKYKIGIIGYGNFGRTLESLFHRGRDLFDIRIFSRGEIPDSKKFYEFTEVINSDFVFPCVPISIFESWLQDNAEKFEKVDKENVTIIEVCSVSELPSKWMQKYLPNEVDLVSSHPLFGPSSSKGGTEFENLKFVLHKLRVKNDKKIGKLIEFLESEKLKVLDLDPIEHDRQVARSQAYGFLIGKIGNDLDITHTDVDTPWFELVLKNQNMVAADTDQLFHDMFAYNEQAQLLLEEFIELVNKLKLEK